MTNQAEAETSVEKLIDLIHETVEESKGQPVCVQEIAAKVAKKADQLSKLKIDTSIFTITMVTREYLEHRWGAPV